MKKYLKIDKTYFSVWYKAAMIINYMNYENVKNNFFKNKFLLF